MRVFSDLEDEIRDRVLGVLNRQIRDAAIFKAYHGIKPYSQAYPARSVGEVYSISTTRVQQIVGRIGRSLKKRGTLRRGEECPR